MNLSSDCFCVVISCQYTTALADPMEVVLGKEGVVPVKTDQRPKFHVGISIKFKNSRKYVESIPNVGWTKVKIMAW